MENKDKSNELKKINDIPELRDYLIKVYQIEGETALGYALQAQLQVLEVIQCPVLYESPFDLLLHSLNKAIELSENDMQKKLIQEKSAIMINSMLFFLEAKIHYENKKWTDEGLNLLKQSCNMLADSLPSIINIILKIAQTSQINEKINEKNSKKGNEKNYEKSCERSYEKIPINLQSIAIDVNKIFNILTKDRTFINRIVDYFSNNKYYELKQREKEFNRLIVSVLNKLLLYKELFGKSIIIAELFNRYLNRIKDITESNEIFIKDNNLNFPSKPKILCEKEYMNNNYLYNKKSPLLFKDSFFIIKIVFFIEIILLILSLVIFGIMKLINFNTIQYLKGMIIGSLFIPITLIIMFIFKIIDKIKFKKQYKEYKEKYFNIELPNYEKELNKFYKAIEYFRTGE